MIRNNKDIQGVLVHNKECKVSQFADDTTCFASSAESVQATFKTLQLYSKCSGLYINYDKSAILPVGKNIPSTILIQNILVKRKVKILGVWFSKDRSEEDHYSWNFLPILQKMRSVCASWSNRTLSLKGRVRVFNSLIYSMVQYVNANTVTPKQVLLEVRKLATTFLWSGKKSKVAYNVVIQSVLDGGLRLMDLEHRTRVNELAWIKRTLKHPNSTSAEMLRYISGEGDLSFILGLKSCIAASPNLISPFYNNILKTWEKVHNCDPEGEEAIRAEILWDNPRISTPKNKLHRDVWRKWIDAGVMMVHHVCHPTESRIMGQEEISNTYNIKRNFLEALSVRQSIPFSWRSQLSANFRPDVEPRYEFTICSNRLNIMDSTPKEWYSQWVQTSRQSFNREDGWAREFGHLPQYHPPKWADIFVSPFKTSRETKLQSFSFKLVYRLIPCNKYLHKIKIRTSPTCSFCTEEDSITHFFLSCPRVKTFWIDLSHWCMTYLDLNLARLSEPELLLGITSKITGLRILNWLILCAKFYIQKRKLFHDANISLIGFLAEIRMKLCHERQACLHENKPRKFKIWKRLYDVLG